MIAYLKDLIQKIKKRFNAWVDKRLLDIKLKSIGHKKDNILLIEYSSEYVNYESLSNYFSNQLKDTKHIMVEVGILNNISSVALKSNDVIQVTVPLDIFYTWDKTNKLDENSALIKDAFKKQGIENRIVIIPDGYTYSTLDYERILEKVNQNERS